MVLYYLITTFYVLVCTLLLLVILLQQGKGDIAAAFGGGSSQSAFGARAGATVLSKATAILAALFMLGALALAIIGQRGPGSVISGAAAPRPVSAPVKPATPAPVTPAPVSPAPTTPAPK
jgi:preprotein translocase subunit SecG